MVVMAIANENRGRVLNHDMRRAGPKGAWWLTCKACDFRTADLTKAAGHVVKNQFVVQRRV